jgi:lipoyl(octanoyl) transferase
MTSNIQAEWLGLSEYNATWAFQQQCAQKVQLSKRGILLGCEHPNVITLGKRVKYIKPSTEEGIPVIETDRGGLATLHAPGQLLLYPILSLREWHFGVREWVEFLLRTTQISLQKCNIIIISSNNGSFTKNGKIASIGISLHKGISTHGLAVNISNDLSLFSKISPCGVQNQAMDKVCNSTEITPEAFFLIWCETFCELLKNRASEASHHLQSP